MLSLSGNDFMMSFHVMMSPAPQEQAAESLEIASAAGRVGGGAGRGGGAAISSNYLSLIHI